MPDLYGTARQVLPEESDTDTDRRAEAREARRQAARSAGYAAMREREAAIEERKRAGLPYDDLLPID